MLCEICENIQYDDMTQENDKNQFPGYPHHQTYAELQSCSDCEFCRLITVDIAANGALGSWQEQRIYLRIFPSSTAVGESNKSNLLVYCSPWQENWRDQTTLATYGLFVELTEVEIQEGMPDPKLPANQIIGGRPTASFSNSDECFQLASRWLRQCVESDKSDAFPHQYFHQFADVQNSDLSKLVRLNKYRGLNQGFRPSRTIDVGPPDGSQAPFLACHTVTELNGPQEWATLSHCWGGSTPLKTTMSTLSERQERIPLFMMPSTFRDAVIITRRLGIRHLWIDALCIIQDSKEDWDYEAARMGNIYKYGLVNIAADTAGNCQDGIFSKRMNPLAPARIPLRSQKLGISSHMYVRSGRWDYCLKGIEDPDSRLSSRAWVLRGILLSPRTLHYSKEQMLWECSHFTFCECSILPIVAAGLSNRLIHRKRFSNKLILPTGMAHPSFEQAERRDAEKRHNLYDIWLQIINDYTKRKLTHQSDILAALTGIASAFQNFLGDRYLAGHFEGDLLRSLLWRVKNPSSNISINPSNPSWSWTWVIGEVIPEIIPDHTPIAPRILGNLGAQVLSAETYLTDGAIEPANHFLHVTEGEINLEGYVLRAGCLADLRYKSEILELIRSHPTNTNRAYPSPSALHLDTTSNPEKPQDMILLHLGMWEWRYELVHSWSKRVATCFAGLVLRPIDATRSLYSRTGIVVMKAEFSDNEIVSRFQEKGEAQIAASWERTAVTLM